jgi:hypothetical protein
MDICTIQRYDNGVSLISDSWGGKTSNVVFQDKNKEDFLLEVYRRCFHWNIGDKVKVKVIAKTEPVNVSIAHIAHDMVREYCKLLGDYSYLSWKDTPEWQKNSCINGVDFLLANPHSTPLDLHDNWIKEKEAAGWKYGPLQDPEKKEHPCMAPHSKLSMEAQMIDLLFILVVRTFSK